MLANLVELNTKRLYRSSGKEKESCCLVPLATQNVKLGTFTSKSRGDGKGMFKKATKKLACKQAVCLGKE